MKFMQLLRTISLVLTISSLSNAFLTPHRRHFYSTSLNADVSGIQEAWTAYNDALEASPLLVKSVTAGVILGAADITGQAIEKQQKGDVDTSLDIARTARFAFFGLVLQAPWNHFYYLLLDGTIPPTEDPFTPTTGIKVNESN